MKKILLILPLIILFFGCNDSAVFKVNNPSRDTTFRAKVFSKYPASMTFVVNGSLDGDFVVGGRLFTKGTYVNDSTNTDWYKKDSIIIPYYSRGAKTGSLEIKVKVH